MRKIDVSPITTSIGFPVKSGTVVHLQAAYQEALSSICQAITGAYDHTRVYVLSGCVNSGSGTHYIISAGSVFYAGEVYQVDAVTFDAIGPNVAASAIGLSYFSAFNADGVQFTDGTVRNVHQIFKVVIAPALSGSGSGNFSTFIRLNLNRPDVSISGTGLANVTGAFPNVVVNVSDNNKILRTGTVSIGDPGASGTVISGGVASTYLITFSSALPNTNYVISPALISLSSTTGGQISDSACNVVIANQTLNGFEAIVKKKDGSSGTANLNLSYSAISTI